MYDTDIIYSWTPREFKNFLTGAQLRTIDTYEQMAKSAMFHRYASNEKRAKESKMFDAKLARQRLLEGSEGWKDSKQMSFSLDRYRKAREAMKGYMPSMNMKGG